jgi:hypothetical protein
MIIAAIVACEVGFWVVLGAGLLARYVLRLRRTGAVLLAGVPLVDLALLVFTVVDLRRGTPAEFAHGLAAVYLGFSIAFGHAMVRWADVRAAHRFAGGPAPAPKPQSGSWARARHEWRDFAKACLAVSISAALLVGAVALVGERSDTGELESWLPRLGLGLAVWLLAWPVWESARACLQRKPANPHSALTPPPTPPSF